MRFPLRLTFGILPLCVLGSLSGRVQAQSSVEVDVVYGMYSGLALLMDVHYPAEPNGYGVIFIYGSGFQSPLNMDAQPLKESDLAHMPSEALLSAGYTLFMINHRAAPRFRYPANVEDAQRAVRFIRYNARRFGIRSDRVGAIGGSTGGYLSNFLGLADGLPLSDDASTIDGQSAKVQAVVSIYSNTDLSLQMQDCGPGACGAIVSFMGLPLNLDQELYREASPISYATEDDPPFLLIHGDEDRVVRINQSESLFQELESLGVTVNLLRMPGGGHGASIVSGPDSPDYPAATVEWFNMYLKN